LTKKLREDAGCSQPIAVTVSHKDDRKGQLFRMIDRYEPTAAAIFLVSSMGELCQESQG
jgi:hypothetical protein